MPSLQELQQRLQQITQKDTLPALDKLKRISREFIHFCLIN